MVNRVVFFGECMAELRATSAWDGNQQALAQSYAGDTFNAAVYCARELQRVEHREAYQVIFFTGIGDDLLSTRFKAFSEACGVVSDWQMPVPDRTLGLYWIETDTTGERSFTYWRSESAARTVLSLELARANLKSLGAGDWFYLSGISLAILNDDARHVLLNELAAFQERGGRVAFDNNYRPRLWASIQDARASYLQISRLADLLLLTWDDEEALFDWSELDQALICYRSLGDREIVIKRGADACTVFAGQQAIDVPAESVADVRDTTAAGDSFGGTYLAQRLMGESYFVSAQRAHRVAAKVVQEPGGIIECQLMPE